MKNLLLTILFVVAAFAGYSSYDFQYEKSLKIAKEYLAYNKNEEALIELQKLKPKYPVNAHLAYCMGIAYLNLGGPENTQLALNELVVAKKAADPLFNYNQYKIDGAPIYVHYYLVRAYSVLNQCSNMHNAFENFRKYTYEEDAYLITECKRLLKNCSELPEPKAVPDLVVEEPKKSYNLLTKKVEFTSQSPIYAVQIAALDNPRKTLVFKDLSNIEVFVDAENTFRYITGSYSFRKQAEKKLLEVKQSGYPDAFIVNLNNKELYKEQVVSVENESIKVQIEGRVSFHVQLASFTSTLPFELVSKIQQHEQVVQVFDGKHYVFIQGDYDSYEQALAAKSALISAGFHDAFIVAFNKERKLNLSDIL